MWTRGSSQQGFWSRSLPAENCCSRSELPQHAEWHAQARPDLDIFRNRRLRP